MSARVVEITPVFDANEVRDFRDVVGAAVEAREGSGQGHPVDLADLLRAHGLEALVYIALDPGHAVGNVLTLLGGDAEFFILLREAFEKGADRVIIKVRV